MQYGFRDRVTHGDLSARDSVAADPPAPSPAVSDPWQIDPVTARIRPAESLQDPVIIVIEAVPSLSLAIAEICEFLHVGITSVTEPRLIPDMLHDIRPIAIMHEAEAVDCTIYDLLMVVAGYDPSLPVMVVVPGGQQSRNAVESAQKLWELTDVVQFGHRPGIRALIEFMFHAGRKFGRTRFMPL